LERTVVVADSLVGRNERIWQTMESGRVLILSIFGFRPWEHISGDANENRRVLEMEDKEGTQSV
jgi:hypothetical protein